MLCKDGAAHFNDHIYALNGTQKAKETDNIGTSNGHAGCACYCYGSFSSFIVSEEGVLLFP